MAIEFDYTIERNQGSGIRVFRPEDIKSPLGNITVISAPNSSGKSTLMNIIALSLFGAETNSGSVNDSLVEQILNLTNLDIQTLKFEIRITSKSGTKGIVAKKINSKSRDIERKEIVEGEEKLIDSERFNQKYRLIYDIPDKPLDRLAELTNDIKFQQNRWVAKLTPLSTYLNDNIKELIRRKENFDIPALKKRKQEIDLGLTTLDANRTNLIKKLETEDKYYCFKTYLQLKQEFEQIKFESKEVNEEKQKQSEIIKNKQEEFAISANELRTLQLNLIDLRNEISDILLNINLDNVEGYQKWREGIRRTPTTTSVKMEQNFIENLKLELDKELKSYLDSNTINEAEFYSKLVSWIEGNLRSNYQIPGTDLTFKNLLDNLKARIRTSSAYVQKKKTLESLNNKTLTIAERMMDFLNLEETISKKYSDMTNAQKTVKLSDVNENKKILDEKKKLLRKQMDELVMRVSKYGQYKGDEFQVALNSLILRFPELHDLESVRTEELKYGISEIGRNISEIGTEIQRKEFEKKELEKKIQQAESLKPHEYENQRVVLEKIRNSIGHLVNTLTYWDILIDRLKNKNVKPSINKVNPEDLDYFNKVSRYLALRMKTLIHIDTKYNLSEVDLVNSRFVSTDGTIIHFSVMGTGQRQLAYILNRLNYDGRTILAIFDEVAMMSLTTMKEIIDKMKELESEGKLLFGILVSPSDNLEVKSW